MIMLLIINKNHSQYQSETGKRAFRNAARVISLAIIFLLTACGDGDGGSSSEADSITVVATTTILGDVVANVVGEQADVTVLMPIGADPHDFQASSAQVAEIHGADLVVANGLHLEEGLDDVLDTAVTDGARVIRVAPLLDPLPFGGDDADHSEDPHVWFDPMRMGDAARLIAEQLDEVEPGMDWSARAEVFAEALADLDAEVVTELSAIPSERRLLVTSHDSLGYFADRYEFDVIGTVIPGGSTLADPSSDELSDLVDVVRRNGVNVIFAETTQPALLAEAVAAELGEEVQVVSLYTGSLDEPGSGADTLIGMLRSNSKRIATALSTS